MRIPMISIKALAGTVVLAISLTLTAVTTQAALMQRDLATAGDNLLAYDSDTNFEWLHFSFTAGMGYQEIATQLGSLAGGGFRFATLGEVTTLYNNAGFDPIGPNSTDPADLAAAQLLHDLLGTTAIVDTRGQGFPIANFNRYQEGWVLPDDTSDPLVYLATVWITDITVSATGDQVTLTSATDVGTLDCDPFNQCLQSTWNAGGYLLRTASANTGGGGSQDIPEPATLVLLATGLAGLALRRRRH